MKDTVAILGADGELVILPAITLTSEQVRSLARELQGDIDDSEGLHFWMEADVLNIGSNGFPETVRILPTGETLDD